MILITGGAGQLGRELALAMPEAVALDREALDVRDPAAVAAVLDRLRPRFVVNAAAYTAVDAAEDDAPAAFAINAEGAGCIASACAARGAWMIHFSTDYVFGGGKTTPYVEEDITDPLNAYGASKLEGERRVLASGARAVLLRTSWLYGWHGRNFMKTMIGRAGKSARVVADQHGTPTSARHLARAVARMLEGEPRSGLYHLCAEGETTWHGFASAILDRLGHPPPIAISTAEYPTRARRPPYSVLSSARFARDFGWQMAGWEEQLAEVLAAGA
jgi:dTDP-4-dehydrorhamnose reductase